jgi:hypothetical protein
MARIQMLPDAFMVVGDKHLLKFLEFFRLGMLNTSATNFLSGFSPCMNQKQLTTRST